MALLAFVTPTGPAGSETWRPDNCYYEAARVAPYQKHALRDCCGVGEYDQMTVPLLTSRLDAKLSQAARSRSIFQALKSDPTSASTVGIVITFQAIPAGRIHAQDPFQLRCHSKDRLVALGF